jgi:hypothetical protein
MTNPMTKILLALFTLAMLTGTALAQSPQLSRGATGQQRTFYDSRGNVVGRSATDSQGTVKTTDAERALLGPSMMCSPRTARRWW